jgi:UPF0042 nucleotide-binding protein
MQNLRIIIVTGMSGSGKSTALRALEDVGFFCVDNLPVVLLPKLLEIQTDAASEISKVALVMDLRERYFLEKYAEIFAKLKEEGHRIEILFLDASDESLLRRFRETRRAHPLCERGTVMEGIALEREKLSALRAMADKIVDTSSFNVHQLKEVIQRHFMTLALRDSTCPSPKSRLAETTLPFAECPSTAPFRAVELPITRSERMGMKLTAGSVDLDGH